MIIIIKHILIFVLVISISIWSYLEFVRLRRWRDACLLRVEDYKFEVEIRQRNVTYWDNAAADSREDINNLSNLYKDSLFLKSNDIDNNYLKLIDNSKKLFAKYSKKSSNERIMLEYYNGLKNKYERYSRYPWIRAVPDSPPPGDDLPGMKRE